MNGRIGYAPHPHPTLVHSDAMGQSAGKLDLNQYFDHFKQSLADRYRGSVFTGGFTALEARFKEIRGGRLLTVDDILALFDADLPYIQDWTKPDRADLGNRLKEFHVPDLLKRLQGAGYDKRLIAEIRYALREISLMGLVLHHLYPDRFAICSHHIGSLLYIANTPSVSKYYMAYCQELREWARALSANRLNVAETQFALWTWYRLAHFGRNEEQRKHRRIFRDDPWVKQRRAENIARSLGEIGRLDLARSYIKTYPDVAAIVAWVEFERAVRQELEGDPILNDRRAPMGELIAKLPIGAIPTDRKSLEAIWKRRNEFVHPNPPNPPPQMHSDEAAGLIDKIQEFIHHNNENAD